jgi:hypothetical protein
MAHPLTQEFAAFIGIDWADATHAVCLQVAGSDTRESSVLAHMPEAIGAWARTLRRRSGGRPIAVCLELTKGPPLAHRNRVQWDIGASVEGLGRDVNHRAKGRTPAAATRSASFPTGGKEIMTRPPYRCAVGLMIKTDKVSELVCSDAIDELRERNP